MTSADFKKVGRLLKEVYAELEREAIADGVDIFSEEFIAVRDQLRSAVLARMGFTLEEYREAKALVAPAKKVDVATQLDVVATKASELESTVQNLHIPDREELLEEAREIAEKVVKAPVIQNNIVERTTKVVEKPTIVKETVVQTINEEYDDKPLFAEIGYLNDKLDNLEIPEAFDPKELLDQMRSEFGEMFEHNINTLGMPYFRKLAMGLQDQIDRNSEYKVRTLTASGTVSPGDNLIKCNGTFTVTLPTASGFAGEYIIKNSGTGIVTVATTGGQTIDDEGTILLNQYDSMVVRSDGTNWIIK